MNIFPLNKDVYRDAVQMIIRYYKEYKNEITHIVEAEKILQNPNNKTIVFVNNVNKLVGMYVYHENNNNYFVHLFILDPCVRGTKMGYKFWKDMVDRLDNKPALISVIKKNKNIRNLISKRGKYLGSYLSKENEEIEYYNLSFKG